MRLSPFPRPLAIVLAIAFALAIVLPGASFLASLCTSQGRALFASTVGPLETRLPKNMRGHFQLQQQYDRIRFSLFGQLPRAILPGKDGWLYFHSDQVQDSASIADLLGKTHYTPDQIKRARTNLAMRQHFADSLGFAYLAAIAPNKSTAYPYGLPDSLRHRRAITRWEAAQPLLTGILKSPLLDLQPVVMSPDSLHPTFYRTDSHWNDEGALSAYFAIVRALGLPPLDTSGWQRDSADYSGDLLRMAYLEDKVHERTLRIRPQANGHAIGPDDRPILRPIWSTQDYTQYYQGTAAQGAFMRTAHPANQAKSIVFHDSYTVFLIPYLAENLGNILWVWGPFDAEIVKKERPSLVLEIRVERYLGVLLGL